MPADSKTPNLTAQAEAARTARLAREAKALRENLRRRKAQGRARAQDVPDQPAPPAAEG